MAFWDPHLPACPPRKGDAEDAKHVVLIAAQTYLPRSCKEVAPRRLVIIGAARAGGLGRLALFCSCAAGSTSSGSFTCRPFQVETFSSGRGSFGSGGRIKTSSFCRFAQQLVVVIGFPAGLHGGGLYP